MTEHNKVHGSADHTGIYEDAIEYTCVQKAFSNVNFATFGTFSGDYLAARRSSSGAQNDEVVLAPRFYRAGTWVPVLCYRQGTDAGIFTLSRSVDALAWTDLGTLDAGAAASASARTEMAGVAIPEGSHYLRLKMATKGVGTSFFGRWNFLSMTRTGA